MATRPKTRISIALLVITSLGVVAWAVAWPFPELPAAPAASLERVDTGDSRLPADSSKGGVEWNRRLRQSTDEISTPTNRVASPPDASIQGLRLLGTIIERDHSYALVSDAQGTIDLQPVGGTFNLEPRGFSVTNIQRSHIILNRNGKTHQLLVSTAAVAPAPTTETGDASSVPDRETVDPTELSLEDELDWLNGSDPGESMQPTLEDRR